VRRRRRRRRRGEIFARLFFLCHRVVSKECPGCSGVLGVIKQPLTKKKKNIYTKTRFRNPFIYERVGFEARFTQRRFIFTHLSSDMICAASRADVTILWVGVGAWNLSRGGRGKTMDFVPRRWKCESCKNVFDFFWNINRKFSFSKEPSVCRGSSRELEMFRRCLIANSVNHFFLRKWNLKKKRSMCDVLNTVTSGVLTRPSKKEEAENTSRVLGVKSNGPSHCIVFFFFICELVFCRNEQKEL